MFEEDRIGSNEYKDIKKYRNKIVEILAKLKSRNLSKFSFKNLPKFKKV